MNFLEENIHTENEQIDISLLKEKRIELWIKREDKIHEFVSGNKFRKLKYNIFEAKSQGKEAVLTFGGAYSNHIVATAVACNLSGLKSIGIIRGEELKDKFNEVLLENDTLRVASENGMQFEFISRTDFRRKNEEDFLAILREKYGDFYLVPEGGTNNLAIKGCEEILNQEDKKFDYICAAVGTGGTSAGIINSKDENQKFIGFSALKGDFLADEIKKLTPLRNNWSLQVDYHFGGYAKYSEELIGFINDFKLETNVLLDPIYTAKMLFGIINLVQQNYFPENSKILAIHTGGLQGIKGVNKKLRAKKIKEIEN